MVTNNMATRANSIITAPRSSGRGRPRGVAVADHAFNLGSRRIIEWSVSVTGRAEDLVTYGWRTWIQTPT